MCDKKLLWEGGSLSRPRYGGRAGLSTCHVETGSRSGAGHPVVSCPGQPAVRSMEAVTAAAVIMQWQPWCTRSPSPAWQLAWHCSQGLVHGSEASAASMTRLSWPECHVIMTVITISLLCFNADWCLLTCTMDSPTKYKIDKGVDSPLARPGCSSSLAEPGWCGPAPALVTGAGPGCQAVYSVTIIADTRHNICNISLATHLLSHRSHWPVVSELSLQSLVREAGPGPRPIISILSRPRPLQPHRQPLQPPVSPRLWSELWPWSAVSEPEPVIGVPESWSPPPLTECNSVLVQPPQSAVRLWALSPDSELCHLLWGRWQTPTPSLTPAPPVTSLVISPSSQPPWHIRWADCHLSSGMLHGCRQMEFLADWIPGFGQKLKCIPDPGHDKPGPDISNVTDSYQILIKQ